MGLLGIRGGVTMLIDDRDVGTDVEEMTVVVGAMEARLEVVACRVAPIR